MGLPKAATISEGSKFGGVTVSDAQRPKTLEQDNACLMQLLVEALLEQAVIKRCSEKVVGAPARREVGHWMCGQGLTESHALKVVGIRTSRLRAIPPERERRAPGGHSQPGLSLSAIWGGHDLLEGAAVEVLSESPSD
jgi:putative transposase